MNSLQGNHRGIHIDCGQTFRSCNLSVWIDPKSLYCTYVLTWFAETAELGDKNSRNSESEATSRRAQQSRGHCPVMRNKTFWNKCVKPCSHVVFTSKFYGGVHSHIETRSGLGTRFFHFYRPPTKFRESNVFKSVCQSFCSQGRGGRVSLVPCSFHGAGYLWSHVPSGGRVLNIQD